MDEVVYYTWMQHTARRIRGVGFQAILRTIELVPNRLMTDVAMLYTSHLEQIEEREHEQESNISSTTNR